MPDCSTAAYPKPDRKSPTLRPPSPADLVIVVERRRDFRWPDPGGRVMTAGAYVAATTGRPRRVINLCRHADYLSAGYYASLLAEARGDRVIPALRTLADFAGKADLADAVADLNAGLVNLPPPPPGLTRHTAAVYFGRTPEPGLAPGLADVAARLFQRLDCPLMRLTLAHDDRAGWRIDGVAPLGPDAVPRDHDAFFLDALDAYVRRRWQCPRGPAAPSFTLAVLHDPDDSLPPSKAATLSHLARVGADLGVRVEVIGRRDYRHLARFDGLFIRETTAVPHHTFRFARKAEALGIPVVDDATSILRCTNKVYLAEALAAHGVATPRTRLVTRATLADLAATQGFPAVLKVPDGAFSRGVERVMDIDAFHRVAARLLARSEIILAQEYLPTAFDWRVGVLGGEVLFVAQYHMCPRHWQIVRHGADGSHDEGATRAVAVADTPPAVLAAALTAARLMGTGLYGVDLKQMVTGPRAGEVVVIEVNDNPNLDVGAEDRAAGSLLWRRVIGHFLTAAGRAPLPGSTSLSPADLPLAERAALARTAAVRAAVA
ncbi:RimK family protein [Nitrospirillum iridis]|uniref:Glutathione synthase/RimK-type ligase-like ATP-grasp enzyme n=1 Tax=Nitrospirillum iridis TaxID=765888 RepID=A0A7X0AWS2_9PROT|nr:RimK family protein [Nitrospirillum iridis]MBB6251538.1 glutathione synthase/RimK-type ligase-like ATP-grasp enzyme [Nitrospirillum iridis]